MDEPSTPKPSQQTDSQPQHASHGQHSKEPAHGSHSLHASSHATSNKSRIHLPANVPWLWIICIVVIIAVIALALFALPRQFSFLSGPNVVSLSDSWDSANSEEEQVEANVTYDPSIKSIKTIDDPGKHLTGFTLAKKNEGYVPKLSDEEQAAIKKAIEPLSANDQMVGFCMIDLETGSGLAYNIDEKVYGASSIKGPFLIYLCQELLESGNLSTSDIENQAKDMITWSDNNSYYTLWYAYSDYGGNNLANWFKNMGVSTDLASVVFPDYSVRESLRLWMNTYLYFQSGKADIVSWAQDLLSNTDYSILRDAADPVTAAKLSADNDGNRSQSEKESQDSNASKTEETDANTSANFSALFEYVSDELQSAVAPIVVYNKGGWINGYDDNALIDAGIVMEGEHPYLISIMTGAPDTDENREEADELAEALWNVRSALRPGA